MSRWSLPYRWLVPEISRGLLASMATSLAAAAGQRLFEGPRLVVDICTALLSWATFSLTHALLTYGVFRRLSGEILRQATSRAFPRRRLVRVLAATDGPTWAIMLGFFSLVGVTPLLLVPDLRRSGPLVTMAALVVIGSWVDVVVCYAVHYALVDRNGQMLDFPGDHPRVFSDYLYLAVATQATFGTTDVTVTHPAMRRTLTRHALLAFFFNTVLVAILISLLVG